MLSLNGEITGSKPGSRRRGYSARGTRDLFVQLVTLADAHPAGVHVALDDVELVAAERSHLDQPDPLPLPRSTVILNGLRWPATTCLSARDCRTGGHPRDGSG